MYIGTIVFLIKECYHKQNNIFHKYNFIFMTISVILFTIPQPNRELPAGRLNCGSEVLEMPVPISVRKVWSIRSNAICTIAQIIPDTMHLLAVSGKAGKHL